MASGDRGIHVATDLPVEQLMLATAADLMRHRFVTISPEESLLETEHIMRLAHLRELSVVRCRILLGTVRYQDVLHATVSRLLEGPRSRLLEIPAESVMMESAPTAAPETPLQEAAAVLQYHEIGCLPVVEPIPGGNQMVGLLVKRDLLRAAFDPGFRWRAR